LVTETVVTDGSSLTLNDDSGGRLTIDSQTGNIVPTTYAFTYIAVDDIAGGVGGVIANLRVEGSGYLRMYATGLVQISNLDLRNSTYNTQVLIEDSPGQVDIYYLDGTETSEDGGQEDSDLVNLKAFVNDTYGELIAGTLGNIITVNLRGDLGQLDAGHTGAWLFGPKSAPIVEEANITEEPQYGWFHSTMNGLNVYGSLFDINIGGALGDLRVQGIIGDIKVNWDYKHNRRDVTQGSNWDDWDGVNGLVWSGKRIEYIDVGDGLADDGGSDLARAGIMSTRTIGEVFISGNRFERIAPDSFGVDETIKNPMVFGEINGAILAGGDDILEILRLTRFVSSEGVIFDGLFSEMTYRYVDAIGKVTGEGSTLTAIVAATGLDSFQCFKYRDFQYTGIVREVNFYYAGAEIDGAEIYGAIVDEVTTSLGATGINNTAITGDITTNSQYFRADYSPRQLSYPVREVRAGGSGMTNTYITANGGDIFKVATNNTGNIIGCTFVSGNSMGKIMSGNIVLSDFHMPGAIGYVRVADDILASQFNVGAIWDFLVGGDIGFLDYDADSTREFFTNLANKLAASGAHTTFMLPYYSDDTKLFYEQFINNFTSTGNIKLILVEIGESVTKTTFNVAGEIYRINVDGDFDSQLTLQGSATAYLKTLTVGGNIAGLISSSGNIGAIISRNGNISADITTTTNGYEAGNVKLIETKNGYTGNLDIAGSLGKLISHSSLGYNPAVVELETAQVINIAGDLDYLLIKAADGTPSHLFTNINVGGNSKTVDIEGTLYGNLIINGNLNKVQVDVALGGNPGELVGSPIEGYKTNIFVFGDLKYLRFNPDADLIANITIGGSINRIYTNGGSIIGDITSLFGTISNVKVRSGDIKGNLQGESIGTVYVNNGNLFGNITATNGNIKLVKVKYGDIKGPSEFNDDPKIIAENGQIQRLMVTNGNIDAGRMIEAKNGIGKVYVKGGYLDGDIDSGRAIDLVDVKGELGGNINAETYINRIKVNGTIFNTFIRSGVMINSIDATNVFSTTISSAWDIN
ncbi:MAG: autotransporter outer membrane beta-barrel domain-containing protein, partial [Planctomycetota bacterium]